MLRHHHGIARNAVHAHRIVCRELRVILHVVKSAIEVFAYSRVGTEHPSLSVKLHRDAVGVLVVAQRTVERDGEIVLFVHARALNEP